MAASDGQLVERVREGDTEAFGELVHRYRDMVYGLGYHLTGEFEAARDLAQEAFIQAYVKLGQLREPKKFAGWLRKIAANCHRMNRRRREVATVALDAEVHPVRDEGAPSEIEVVVREALGRLREPDRLALTLHYIDGYSHAEIGSFLDVRPETVKTRLARARQHLRQEVIAMVEGTFDDKKLRDEFTKETLDAAIARAAEHLEQGRVGPAIEVYEGILERSEDYVPALVGLGQTHETIGRYEQALPYLRRAVEREPENVEARRSMCWILSTLKRWDELGTAYEEWLQYDPVPGLHVSLADVYLGLGRHELVEQHVQLALKGDPSLLSANRLLAYSLSAQGRHDEALALLIETAGKDSQDEMTLLHVARTYYGSGNYDDAIDSGRRALLMDGKRFYDRFIERCVRLLERCYHDTGRIDTFPEICRGLRDELADGERSDRVQWYLALFLESRLQCDEAVAEFERLGAIPARCWRVIAPFDNTAGGGMLTEYPPEQGIALEDSYAGKQGYRVRWKHPVWEGAGYELDFTSQIHGPGVGGWSLGYGLLRIVSPEAREVDLRFGASRWTQIWLNGESIFLDRTCLGVPEQERASLSLRRGSNELLMKVGVQEAHLTLRGFQYYWSVFSRITDADGEPVRDLSFPLAD